jgi:hypothetical protein
MFRFLLFVSLLGSLCVFTGCSNDEIGGENPTDTHLLSITIDSNAPEINLILEEGEDDKHEYYASPTLIRSIKKNDYILGSTNKYAVTQLKGSGRIVISIDDKIVASGYDKVSYIVP